jgi:hypothetical protein
VNRKRLILGISIAALLILIVSGVVWFQGRQSRQAEVNRRFPLQRLGYCSSDQATPCVVSFSQDSDGKMLVNFLTTGAFYPDFYLKIKQGDVQHIYGCRKASTFATSVYCTGAALPLGQVFQFSIFSLKKMSSWPKAILPSLVWQLAHPQSSPLQPWVRLQRLRRPKDWFLKRRYRV